MRVGPQPIIARPAWYDRNPIQIVADFESWSAGPHTVTDRLTYTVPAGKRALLELAQVKLYRVTAATTAGIARIILALTPSGGSTEYILEAHIRGNTVGDKDSAEIASALILMAGDALVLKTVDPSTGGTIDYVGSYKITEFDA